MRKIIENIDITLGLVALVIYFISLASFGQKVKVDYLELMANEGYIEVTEKDWEWYTETYLYHIDEEERP